MGRAGAALMAGIAYWPLLFTRLALAHPALSALFRAGDVFHGPRAEATKYQ